MIAVLVVSASLLSGFGCIMPFARVVDIIVTAVGYFCLLLGTVWLIFS